MENKITFLNGEHYVKTFASKTWFEKVRNLGIIGTFIRDKVDGDIRTISLNDVSAHRIGNRAFTKNICKGYVKINKSKITISCEALTKREIIKYLNISWIRDDVWRIYGAFLCTNTIFKLILNNKINGEDSLINAIKKYIIKYDGVHFRLLKKYLHNRNICNFMNVRDLIYFTRDVNKSIEVLLNTDNINPYHDLLAMAIRLGEKVDFSWSARRIEEEHRRQIEEDIYRECEDLDKTTVGPNISTICDWEVLNSEYLLTTHTRAAHNCMASYYHKIKDGKYMILYTIIEGKDVYAGYNINKGEVSLEQVHYRYNQQVDPEIKLYAEMMCIHIKAALK